ncbi:unnamed protein product [Tenebrio molitor]|nr:unnamed protein product [Tenebrio molitor]
MYSTSDYIVHEDFDNATQRNDIGLVRLNSKLVFDDNTKPIALAEDGFDNSALRSNIALVRLNESLTFNDKVQAIALSDEELGAGVEVTVSGWGHTSDDDNSDMYDVLRYVKVNTIDNSRCQEVYGNDVILPEMVCTDNGVPAKGPCSGDGGDPVVVDVDGNPVLVAIFSFVSNLGCESALPAGYTRTAYYKDWIKEISGI